LPQKQSQPNRKQANALQKVDSMRKTCKPPQVVTILWPSDFADGVCATDPGHCDHTEEFTRSIRREKNIPISFRDDILKSGKPLAIHPDEPD
jgi:hypothetical protein